MKTIKNMLLAGALLAPAANAQEIVTAGPSTDDWIGFVNVFELDCVMFVFQQGWGVPDLTATFDDGAGTIELQAMRVPGDTSSFWFQGMGANPGGPGVPGNKCIDAALFIEVNEDPMTMTPNPLSGVTVTFTGEVLSNTLANGYTANIFIRDFAPDFQSLNENIILDAQPGPFSFSLDTDPGAGRHVQYGYQIIGPNVFPGDEDNFGSFIVGQGFPGGLFSESCNGDGGDQMGCTNCPCGNDAPQGTNGGCINSAGTSSRLLGSGSDSVTAADLRFEASGVAPQNSCVLTSGNALAPANMANPCFGLNSGVTSVSLDGLRCAVQGVLRHGVRPSDVNGEVGVTTNGWGTPNGFFNFGAFTSGTTKHFQIIHRDDVSLGCGTGQNTSQAVSVNFTP